MADEDKLKVQSLPPPPTDEIDEDWGSSGAASASPQKGSAGEGAKGEGSKASSKSAAQPKKKAARPDPEEDDDEDDDEDDEDDEDDDDDDEGDDDDDEDDDDDDDDEPRQTKARRGAGSSFDDLIPDWAPWAVLGLLLLVGFLGGIGVFGGNFNLKPAEATASPTPSAAPAAVTTPTARPTVARSARPPTAEDGEMVSASHLLVAYQGALRAAPTTTRTKEEAKKRATEAQKKASKKGADFAKLVAEYSDEPGAAQRGGSLGKFTRGRMVKEFADAAFAMKVNEISDVVETKFGFHVIKRTE